MVEHVVIRNNGEYVGVLGRFGVILLVGVEIVAGVWGCVVDLLLVHLTALWIRRRSLVKLLHLALVLYHGAGG